jgi:hypothetical protein
MKVLALAALLMILTPESCDQAGMDARAKADQAAAERKLGAGLDPMATRSCSPDQRFERTEVVSTPDASGYSPGHLYRSALPYVELGSQDSEQPLIDLSGLAAALDPSRSTVDYGRQPRVMFYLAWTGLQNEDLRLVISHHEC